MLAGQECSPFTEKTEWKCQAPACLVRRSICTGSVLQKYLLNELIKAGRSETTCPKSHKQAWLHQG